MIGSDIWAEYREDLKGKVRATKTIRVDDPVRYPGPKGCRTAGLILYGIVRSGG